MSCLRGLALGTGAGRFAAARTEVRFGLTLFAVRCAAGLLLLAAALLDPDSTQRSWANKFTFKTMGTIATTRSFAFKR